jgi:hypothetical protein
VPDWVLTIPRLVWAPVRWAVRRVRHYTANREALRREGSAVVTPVIQFTKGIGPMSVAWGEYEEKRAYLEEQSAKWPKLGDDLMTYANHHPSDRVRTLAKEVEKAVAQDIHNTAFLLGSQQTEYAHEAFKATDKSHNEALDKTERLMDEIRRY